MSQLKQINRKAKLVITRKLPLLWTVLLLASIASLIVLYYLSSAINNERVIKKQQMAISVLGYKLKGVSDFLTAEARSFAVTQNPIHLKNYWYDIHVSKKRTKIINQLIKYKESQDIAYLLIKSKRNSDALVNTEIRSMYLILSANDVPINLYPLELRSYHPLPSDIQLTSNEKILVAQKIMFDKSYYQNKKLIMNPIKEFETKLLLKIKHNTLQSQITNDRLFITLTILLIILSLIIDCISWFRLIE